MSRAKWSVPLFQQVHHLRSKRLGDSLEIEGFSKGSKKESKEFLVVYLVNETKANVTVKSCFYILDSSHSIQNRITFDTVHVFEPTADWGFQQFLKLSTQKDESSKKKILLICANSFKKKIEII